MSVFDTIVKAKTENADADVQATRLVYDPRGNSHAFNKGFGPAWWFAMQKERNNGASGERKEFTESMSELMKDAGAYWDLRKGLNCTKFDDGSVLESSPKIYNLHRADTGFLLKSGVPASSPLTPYYKIVCIPDNVGISFQDFLLNEDPDVIKKMSGNEKAVYEAEMKAHRERAEKIKGFLGANNVDVNDFDKKDLKIPLNKILKPAGVNCWQNGKSITAQYFIGEYEPRPGDKHRVYFTVEASLDGTKAARYYLTIVRVVCENTQMHAEADGWTVLLGMQKERQRIRRTANFEENLVKWHSSMVNVLIGAIETLDVFSKLAKKKIAEDRNQREAIIKAFIADSFGIDVAKAKTKRAENGLAKILDAVYMDTLGGGKECETYFDLLNGVTNYRQNFAAVNGLDSEADRFEKRFMLNLTDDGTVKENQQLFVKLLDRAA